MLNMAGVGVSMHKLLLGVPCDCCCCRFGDIGRRMAVLARAYEMRVVALRRHVDKSKAELDSGLLVGCTGVGRTLGPIYVQPYVWSILPSDS